MDRLGDLNARYLESLIAALSIRSYDDPNQDQIPTLAEENVLGLLNVGIVPGSPDPPTSKVVPEEQTPNVVSAYQLGKRLMHGPPAALDEIKSTSPLTYGEIAIATFLRELISGKRVISEAMLIRSVDLLNSFPHNLRLLCTTLLELLELLPDESLLSGKLLHLLLLKSYETLNVVERRHVLRRIENSKSVQGSPYLHQIRKLLSIKRH